MGGAHAADQNGEGPRPETGLIVVLIAPSSAGKTTACGRTAELAQRRGWEVAGVLAPPIYNGQNKVAIALRNLRTGQEHILARVHPAGPGPQTGQWWFDPATIAWGQHLLASLPPCDLLVIDEIGPLELQQREGLTNALYAVSHAAYRLALMTLRPELIDSWAADLSGRRLSILALEAHTRDQVPETVLALWPATGERNHDRA